MHTKTVLELITDRMFAKNNNVPFNDGAKLCLAVEGGAMRGVISMGMLIALYDLNILDIFDNFIGVSAGSMNLAYVLSGQGALGLSIYFEEMTDKDIVNLLRFRSDEHPIMDVRKIYDHTTQQKRLDTEKLQAHYGSAFQITVYNVTKNRGELININNTGQRFMEFMAAGAMLPFIAGDPWIIDDDRYFDGGMHYIDPSQAAQEINASHTLVLNTRTQDKPIKPWGRVVQRRVRHFDDRYPGLGTQYLKNMETYFQAYNALPFGTTQLNNMQLYRHALPESVGVGRLTMDSEKLVNGMKKGYQSGLDIFYQQGRVGILPTLM